MFFVERATNSIRYAVDVTGGGRSSAMRCLIHKSVSIVNGSCPSSMMGRNGTMISGTVAWSSSGADFGVRDVSDNEPRQPCEQPDGLGEVLRLRLVEVEDDWEVAALAEFLAQPLQDGDPAFGEPPEQQHALSTDRVDDVAYLLVVEQEIDELRHLDVIDGDLGLVPMCDDQVLLLGSLQL